MHTPHILLVDDDPATLQALPRMLELRIREVQVDRASSAFEALQRIQQRDYDAIVSDIMMPGLSGLELLAQVKRLRSTTPVLLITGHFDPDLLQQAIDAGAYDFIQKPIERLALVASIHRAIQAHQLQCKVEQQQSILASYARLVGPLTGNTTPTKQVRRQNDTPFQPPAWLL
jgi:two-component system C4-dicarboxylate transport response regulator DctD